MKCKDCPVPQCHDIEENRCAYEIYEKVSEILARQSKPPCPIANFHTILLRVHAKYCCECGMKL